jgi:hypothetical protein
MAHYTRFEIYLPITYIRLEVDPESGGQLVTHHSLDEKLVRDFIEEAVRKYGGLTQANPLAPPLYKGLWRSKGRNRIEIDFLTYLFGLVQIDESDKARRFFEKWKRDFEREENQELVLVIHYPVQTIGDFF